MKVRIGSIWNCWKEGDLLSLLDTFYPEKHPIYASETGVSKLIPVPKQKPEFWVIVEIQVKSRPEHAGALRIDIFESEGFHFTEFVFALTGFPVFDTSKIFLTSGGTPGTPRGKYYHIRQGNYVAKSLGIKMKNWLSIEIKM